MKEELIELFIDWVNKATNYRQFRMRSPYGGTCHSISSNPDNIYFVQIYTGQHTNYKHHIFRSVSYNEKVIDENNGFEITTKEYDDCMSIYRTKEKSIRDKNIQEEKTHESNEIEKLFENFPNKMIPTQSEINSKINRTAKRLMMAMQHGIAIDHADGHRWLCFNGTTYGGHFEELLHEKEILPNPKIYGNVIDALNYIDYLMKLAGYDTLEKQFDDHGAEQLGFYDEFISKNTDWEDSGKENEEYFESRTKTNLK